MDQERIVVFDEGLQIEAYRFNGLMQKFPNHFHDHYVIGFVQSGQRYLSCKNKEYTIAAGDIVLFNPGDNHGCYQIDDKSLDWRSINVKKEVMLTVTKEITGKGYLPEFTSTVIYRSELATRLKDLHELLLERNTEFEKEEIFYFLIEELIADYTDPVEQTLRTTSGEIQKACDFMDENFAESISLDDLVHITGLKKYTLLRYFVRQKGVTPYQYLETIRVNEAKKCLEQGTPPVDAALQSGFTDQSHFTRFFKNYIGLTPKQYQDIFKEQTMMMKEGT